MSEKYQKNPQRFYDNFHGVEVQCMGKEILLRCNGQKFFAESEEKAFWNSMGFWKKILRRLENRLGVIILKPNSCSMECLYHEWETQDSCVGIDARERGKMWRVFHSEDGKLRLTTDFSNSRPSHEAHHKRDGFNDSETFNHHVNAILDHPSTATLPQLANALFQSQSQIKEIASGLNSIVILLKSQYTTYETGEKDKKDIPNYVG